MDASPITLQPYVIYRGVAAEDIKPDTVDLLVVIPEITPSATSGPIAAGITQETVTLQTRSGKPISGSVTSANHLVATWDGKSNQRYPPLIRKGEAVEVWRTEGQDKYRWKATGNGRDLRATDRVHMEVGATDPSKPAAIKDDTNTYSAYLDSVNQKVGMRTSKANGEAAAFSMEADLKTGTFHLSDDNATNGNRIFLDTGATSGTPIFQVNLTSGITLKMEGEDLYLKVPGKLLASVGDRVILDSPLTIVNREQKGVILVNASSVAINAAKSFIVTAGTAIGLNAASTKIAGVLAAAKARLTTAVKAPYGQDYTASTIADQIKSPINEASNSADTDMTGTPYRNP
jgi:hypothetical protein